MIEDMMKPEFRNYIIELSSNKYGVDLDKKKQSIPTVSSFRKLNIDWWGLCLMIVLLHLGHSEWKKPICEVWAAKALISLRLCPVWLWHSSQRACHIEKTLHHRRCIVMTLQRRCTNVMCPLELAADRSKGYSRINQQTEALIRLNTCAGWSGLLLFASWYNDSLVSILHESIAGRYRPVRVDL